MSDPSLASAAPAHLLCVVAARPNLMKMAPILAGPGAPCARRARDAIAYRPTLRCGHE